MAKRDVKSADSDLPRGDGDDRPKTARRGLRDVRERLEIQAEELRLADKALRLQAARLGELQDALRAAQKRSAELFDFAPAAYCVLDRFGIVIGINLVASRMLGAARYQIEGFPFRRFVAIEDRDRMLDHMRRCRQERGQIVSELRLSRDDRGHLPAQLVSWRSLESAGFAESFPTLITDFTDHQKASDARSLLLKRLMEYQEAERTRLSRELHDQMGQHVVSLMLGLRALQTRLAGKPEVREIAALLKIADDIGQEAHRVASNLRPTSLDDLGLQAALSHLVNEWSLRTGVLGECHFMPIAGARLPSELETTLYRSVQEALNNVARHSGASHASVIVTADTAFVNLVVEDDGRGFNVKEALQCDARTGRLGLLGLRERIELAGGRLEIESAPGAGTTLYIRAPIPMPTVKP